MFLFIRLLPMISIFEMRTLLPEAQAKDGRARSGALMATDGRPIYGLLAEFDTPQALVDAARADARRRLSRAIDAFSPFPIEELREALGPPRSSACR